MNTTHQDLRTSANLPITAYVDEGCIPFADPVSKPPTPLPSPVCAFAIPPKSRLHYIAGRLCCLCHCATCVVSLPRISSHVTRELAPSFCIKVGDCVLGALAVEVDSSSVSACTQQRGTRRFHTHHHRYFLPYPLLCLPAKQLCLTSGYYRVLAVDCF